MGKADLEAAACAPFESDRLPLPELLCMGLFCRMAKERKLEVYVVEFEPIGEDQELPREYGKGYQIARLSSWFLSGVNRQFPLGITCHDRSRQLSIDQALEALQFIESSSINAN